MASTSVCFLRDLRRGHLASGDAGGCGRSRHLDATLLLALQRYRTLFFRAGLPFLQARFTDLMTNQQTPLVEKAATTVLRFTMSE